MNAYEVAVIGSGPSGAVTAFHLAKAGFHVVLLEEGAAAAAPIPAFSLEEVQAKYRNAGLTTMLGKPSISYVEGRCVGGGSEVNSGLYQQCPEAILQEWERHYEVQDLRHSLNEHHSALESEFFEASENSRESSAQKLHKGAEKLRWKWLDVPQLKFESHDTLAFRKKSMGNTYIPAALKEGCTLLSDTRVERVERRRRDGWRLHCRQNDGRFLELDVSFVFVCAGAIHSAALLLRSGIQKNIGQSLAVHPTAKMIAEFREPLDSLTNMPGTLQIKEFAPDLNFGCSVRSPPFLAATMTALPHHMRAVLERHSHMAIYYAMIRGPSVGRIRVLPGLRDPLVSYELPREQQTNLAEGLKKLHHLLQSAGAETIHSPTGPRGTPLLATYHLFASIPFGENRALTAADSYGALHGVKNIFVSDASLFCTAPGVNPQATIMAIARRNVLHFIATKRRT